MSNSEGNPNMTMDYEPYFKVMKQVSAERGAKYEFGREWASVDNTRGGERVVVEATFHGLSDETNLLNHYFEVRAFEYDGDTPELVDAATGATPAELMRFVEKWV